MAATTHPITVEEFDRLELPQDKDWELRNGEVVEVSIARIRHRRLQNRIAKLFDAIFADAEVLMEYPCQIGDFDKRSADVAVASMERARTATATGVLIGAPEIVVEVLSRSNSAEDVRHYQRVCLSNGTLLFLVVYPKDQMVDAVMPGTPLVTYGIDEAIPVAVLGVNTTLPVAKIFEGIEP
jgi:Uma2 family endonuclease